MKEKYLAFVFDKKIINENFYELIPIDYVVGDLMKKKKNESLLISNGNTYRFVDKNDYYNNVFAYPFLIENLKLEELELSKTVFFKSVQENRYFQSNIKKQKKFYRLTKNGYITQIDMSDGFSFYEHDGLLYNVGTDINNISDEYIYQIIRLINVGMNSVDISKLVGDYQSIDYYEKNQKIELNSTKTLNIGNSYESLISTIINQDNVIKDVLLTIQNNIEKSNLNYPISNILLIGPTGVGKTLIVQEISNTLNVPFVKVDINSITEVGYVGDNVTDCLVQLYLKANRDIELAKKGIVFIDEIDKIARNGSNDHIKTVGVQNSLLKLLEGNEYQLNVDNKKSIIFDSTNVTFIAAGAFSNITSPKLIKSAGFIPNDKITELKNIENELIKYGMESELIGRFSKILKLNNLDLESFKKIIFSKKGIFNYYLDLFKKYDIKFEYDEKFIDAVARKALDKMGGARGINKLIEYVFSDCLWRIYTTENKYSQLLIDENIVDDNKKYILK